MTYLFTLRENEELTRVKECQTSRKEELRALRSIFHCEIQKKKKLRKINFKRRKKAVVPSLTLAPEINATFINVHI